MVKVSRCHARLSIKCILVLREDFSILRMVIGGHQVPLLHVTTNSVALVKVWRCLCLAQSPRNTV